MMKSKPPLCAVKYIKRHYAVKEYGGVDEHIHVFLISAIVGGGQLCATAALNRKKVSPVPMHKRLSGLQNRCGRHGEKKKEIAFAGTQTPNPGPSSPLSVVISTALSRLTATPLSKC
jgi:hypothetical protein